ncbi:hypothetical protein ACRYI5_07225 [Furfurilactobacillus sp. WILCCON 0119]|uniref:hypothetical protein n=1 Tax=Furfurilactobacillus entadae TaxID=2922307 RepID=UPI0035E5EF4F
MELTATDFDILSAIADGRVESGTPLSHFVDYCDNAIGGNPRPLIQAGYIEATDFTVTGLTPLGEKVLKEHQG